MSECINRVFIYNGKVVDCSEFERLYPKNSKLLYEVIRVIEGIPLFLKEHLRRLKNSITIAKVNVDFSEEFIGKYIENLISENSVINGNVKIIIDEHNTLVYSVKHSYPTEKMYNSGVRTILYFGERENPNAKVINNTFREEVNKSIKQAEAYEAILVDNQGYITEGSRSNIFMIRGNEVYTAPLKDVLPGITREMIIKACENLSLKVIEKNVHYTELKNLDGLFISGTSPKVLPISEVGEVSFNLENNKWIKTIMKEFERIIQKDLEKYNHSN